MYFSFINGVISVPTDVHNKVINGEENLVSFKTITKDQSGCVTTTSAINNYLSTYKMIYDESFNKGVILSESELVSRTNEIYEGLDTEVVVKEVVSDDTTRSVGFLNFASYIFVIFIVGIVATVLISMRREAVFKRVKVSPYPSPKYYKEIALAGIMITLFAVGIIFGVQAFIAPEILRSLNGIYFLTNITLYAVSILSIALLLSFIIKKDAVIGMVSTVFALSQAFLTGAFLPREFMGQTLKVVGHVFPSYYVISNNNAITGSANITFGDLWVNYFIMVIIALISFIAILLINRHNLVRKP